MLCDASHSVSMGQKQGTRMKQQGAGWDYEGLLDVGMREHVATMNTCLSNPAPPLLSFKC